MRSMPWFCGKTTALMHPICSSRPMATSRRSSSVPSPCRWNASRTSRENSASSFPYSRLNRPRAMISWSPVSGSLKSATSAISRL